ncbi:hypothetical protein FJT64_002171 [Amphibalanus amphitrite]|uniref:Uncharacterized protein n=1 Tax=Amphibalanus amphitrite TaxID=1232801 RepID=A0A6A4WWY0_AMPAM|nr:hypothetical protein FJT64_002171 [Amphibalanus amphitrite]
MAPATVTILLWAFLAVGAAWVGPAAVGGRFFATRSEPACGFVAGVIGLGSCGQLEDVYQGLVTADNSFPFQLLRGIGSGTASNTGFSNGGVNVTDIDNITLTNNDDDTLTNSAPITITNSPTNTNEAMQTSMDTTTTTNEDNSMNTNNGGDNTNTNTNTNP